MVEQVERITEIEGFGKYITAMLEIDAFFVNEDRHTNNIAVIYNEKTQRYSLSPLFDQGLCIFADTSARQTHEWLATANFIFSTF